MIALDSHQTQWAPQSLAFTTKEIELETGPVSRSPANFQELQRDMLNFTRSKQMQYPDCGKLNRAGGQGSSERL